ncbi:DUF2066 domain-containing protein [Chelativorans salis]|uniref:DUF2066 domain-containing protein n=1 Tax=Chelativorans salis TaxID=2978478 RepID=A0ABT2LRX4_9HYPH|nr:DUF2066 domain-containing protein [Chelativorans sp. EGI FJ00035]MCT7376602.1 DUF2066 domain-containing protein [Chelativorans sp. EGI FJ00035]
MPAAIARSIASLCIALPLFLTASVHAQEPNRLYSAVTIITGTLEAEKQRGFAACLEEVLVKVSGDTSLAGLPKVDELGKRASEFVETYSLRDRMAGIPVHDEQGTRDRPHFLKVDFSPAKIDQALGELGRAPWTERPVITLLIGIDNGAQRFLLARNSALGIGQRKALSEIAGRLGLKAKLLGEAALAAVPVDHASLGGTRMDGLETIRNALGGEVVLSGMLVWDESAFRWTSNWQLVSENGAEAWEAAGVSFDTAFRDALAEAMQILSNESRR